MSNNFGRSHGSYNNVQPESYQSGSQGNQNFEIDLVDQTQPQPRQVMLTDPIEEGASNLRGQARFVQAESVDHDGSDSLLDGVNPVNGILNDGAHSRPPPVEASPSLGTSPTIVPSQGSRTTIYSTNDSHQYLVQDTGAQRFQLEQDQFGQHLHVRSEGYTSNSDVNQNEYDSRYPTSFHEQSASGFSGAGMNEASGGQLRSIRTASALNLSQHKQEETPASLCGRPCVVHDEQVQPLLPAVKAYLKKHLGDEEYQRRWSKCYKTFQEAGKDHAIATSYADQLLSFQNVGDAIKCLLCHNSYDISVTFAHRPSCVVQRAYRQALNTRRSYNRESEACHEPNGRELPALPPTPSLPPRLYEVNEPSVTGRNEAVASPITGTPLETTQACSAPVGSSTSYQIAETNEQGAREDCETTHIKTVEGAGQQVTGTDDVFEQLTQIGYTAERIQEVKDRSGKMTFSSVEAFLAVEEEVIPNGTVSNPAGPDTLTHSEPYLTALNDNLYTYPSRGPSVIRSSVLQPTGASTRKGFRPDMMPSSPTAAATSMHNGVGNCKHPEYSNRQSRLQSFQKWPANAMQTPQALAESGLFYTGYRDVCRCFNCGGELRRWEADDNPWFEHARSFPLCPFLLQERGQPYIQSVMKTYYEKEKKAAGTHQIKPKEVRQMENIAVIHEDFQSSSSLPASRASCLDASICKVCNKNKVGVAQYECGHIVCRECAPDATQGARCKICDEEVVQCVAVDASRFRK